MAWGLGLRTNGDNIQIYPSASTRVVSFVSTGTQHVLPQAHSTLLGLLQRGSKSGYVDKSILVSKTT